MYGEELFTISRTSHPDIPLGEYPCDIPFSGGDAYQSVHVTLTWDSPRAKHGIPVLQLEAGHTMDFTAREQTPAGHAAKLVGDWLNSHDIEGETRHLVELFLWQWPGIAKAEDGRWYLVDTEERRKKLDAPCIDVRGHAIERLPEAVLDSPNLQVCAYGFCRKPGPCFLLDACLNCPMFATNRHFLPAIEARMPEIRSKRDQAAISNQPHLVEACRQTLEAIDRMRTALNH